MKEALEYILGTTFGKEQRANIGSYPHARTGEVRCTICRLLEAKHAPAEARNSGVFGARRRTCPASRVRQALVHQLMDYAIGWRHWGRLESTEICKAEIIDPCAVHRAHDTIAAVACAGAAARGKGGRGGFLTGLEVRGEAPGRPSWRT